MHYVEHFNINGVCTRQVACIKSNGRPNAATEGGVGTLCIDITSPTHDVYKCVAVNGSIYTWELLSSGGSAPMDNYYTKDEIDELLENIQVDVQASGKPIEVSSEDELKAGEVGSIYTYTGESGTFENGAMYLVEEGE